MAFKQNMWVSWEASAAHTMLGREDQQIAWEVYVEAWKAGRSQLWREIRYHLLMWGLLLLFVLGVMAVRAW